jgi:hypothetical protein
MALGVSPALPVGLPWLKKQMALGVSPALPVGLPWLKKQMALGVSLALPVGPLYLCAPIFERIGRTWFLCQSSLTWWQ